MSVRHRPRRLRTTPWRLFRPAPAERLDSDGEAPLEAWLAFARPESVRPEAHAADLPPMPVARPVIYGRRAADR